VQSFESAGLHSYGVLFSSFQDKNPRIIRFGKLRSWIGNPTIKMFAIFEENFFSFICLPVVSVKLPWTKSTI
jgi:hypothetical protein